MNYSCIIALYYFFLKLDYFQDFPNKEMFVSLREEKNIEFKNLNVLNKQNKTMNSLYYRTSIKMYTLKEDDAIIFISLFQNVLGEF